MFCQALAAAYPEAIKIQLVHDNLITHDTSAFYENLPADEAFALAERFEFYFTPKSASCLNMIEAEFSALIRFSLARHIPSMDQLEREVMAQISEYNSKKIKNNWQLSIQSASNKLNSHYVAVHDNYKLFKISLFAVYLVILGKNLCMINHTKPRNLV